MELAKKIGQNTFIKFTQSLANAFFGIITGYFVLRHLDVAEFGVFTLALSFVWVIMPWIDLGVSQVVISDIANYLGAGDRARARRMFGGFARVKIYLSSLVSVGALIIIYFLPYEAHYLFLLRLSVAVLFLGNLKSIFSVAFESHSRFAYAAIFSIAESIGKLASVAIFILFFKMQSTGVILSYITSSTIALLAALPFFVKILTSLQKTVASPDRLFKNLLLKHGKFQILSQPIKTLSDNFQIWYLGGFFGAAAVGLSRIASQIYGYISMFLSSSENVMLPILSEETGREPAKIGFITERIGKYLLWLSLPMMIGGYFFVPPVLRLIFGNKYDAAMPFLFMMLLSLPLVALGVGLRPVFFAFKDQKNILKTHLLTIGISYPIAILLSQIFGALGFVSVIPIAAAVSLLVRIYYLKKHISERLFKFRKIFVFDDYDMSLMRRVFLAAIKKIKYAK
jgi:O-antigen/teichoic acid export membrane protein